MRHWRLCHSSIANHAFAFRAALRSRRTDARRFRHSTTGLANYAINKDGSVSIEGEQGPRTLPGYMVLKGPNPTGHAVWWFTDAGGDHRDYCFAPGTLT